mgnify:CR=1 FL=1
MGVAHWDEVDSRRSAKGEMDAEWQWLGRAAGTRGVGVNRVRVAPGRLPTPPHSPSRSSVKVCNPYDEKVVNPPRKPTRTTVRAVCPAT